MEDNLVSSSAVSSQTAPSATAPGWQTQAQSLRAIDYADTNNWLAIPSRIVQPVDVFYLYPTAFFPEPDGPFFADIGDPAMRSGAAMRLATQASAFSTCANIFAPYYRQADAARMPAMTNKQRLAYVGSIPTADAFAALDYYFANYNGGRPFIIAGHSQGSMVHIFTLGTYLQKHYSLAKRMVAAYVIGYGISPEYLKQHQNMKFATKAGDTGVIVSWNTEAPANAGASSIILPGPALVINPLNWQTNETPAPASQNKGSLIEDEPGQYNIKLGLADAQIDKQRGVIVCTTVQPTQFASLHTDWFGPASYHGSDYALYYMNLRENAELRVSNYLQKQRHANR